jgi:hypothetical protein
LPAGHFEIGVGGGVGGVGAWQSALVMGTSLLSSSELGIVFMQFFVTPAGHGQEN